MEKIPFSPQDYPLPYVTPDMKEWPIHKLSQNQQEFITSVKQTAAANLKKRFNSPVLLKEELQRVVYQERIRLKEKPWKADPEDEPKFWGKIKKRVLQLEQAEYTEDQILDDIIDRYAEEILGRFSIKTFLLARAILPQIFGRILKAAPGKWFKTLRTNAKTIHEKIPITGDIEKIRYLSTKGTLIVVPTHFSNLDSIMVGWVLSELGLPAFTYGGGLNLFGIRILAYFMNNLGAYKVDRRKKNSVYLETLKTYSRCAIERGAHSIFFPGGTRSRSGSLERKLKLGLLGTALEAQKLNFKNNPDGSGKKIFVVPVVFNYHFVLEAESLINDYLKETGKERFYRENDDLSTSFNIVRFIIKFLYASSSICISFGNVMDVLGNEVDEEGNSFNHLGQNINVQNYFMTNGVLTDDQQREEEYTKILGERIVENYFRFNTVLTSHLVCFSAFELLKKKYPNVDIFTLLRTPLEDVRIPYDELVQTVERLKERLKKMNNNGEIQLSRELRWTTDKLIEDGLKNINNYHANSPLINNGDGTMSSEDLKLLYYYHNRLDGYHLHSNI